MTWPEAVEKAVFHIMFGGFLITVVIVAYKSFKEPSGD